MFRYWIKLLQSNDNCVAKRVYSMLKFDADNNISYNKLNWAFHIKSILEMLKFMGNKRFVDKSEQRQFNFLSIIKQRIFAQYHQSWYSDINNSQTLISYSRFKHNFELKDYLDSIQNNNKKKQQQLITALCRFRLSSHKLEIERGRYHNIPKAERTCKFCTLNAVENEYHFLLVCPLNRKRTYLKHYYCRWPTLSKFDKLMSSTNLNEILNLLRSILHATKLRNNNHN